MDTAFEAFCEAGLWPSLGRTTAGRLPAAHVNRADDVTEDALAAIEGVSAKRAKQLVKTFQDARPRLAVADTALPWRDLGSLATEILLRIDGSKSTMSIVTGLGVAPSGGVRVLASLVCRGLVELLP